MPLWSLTAPGPHTKRYPHTYKHQPIPPSFNPYRFKLRKIEEQNLEEVSAGLFSCGTHQCPANTPPPSCSLTLPLPPSPPSQPQNGQLSAPHPCHHPDFYPPPPTSNLLPATPPPTLQVQAGEVEEDEDQEEVPAGLFSFGTQHRPANTPLLLRILTSTLFRSAPALVVAHFYPLHLPCSWPHPTPLLDFHIEFCSFVLIFCIL